MWVLDIFFYYAENIAEEVIMKWRSGLANRWQMRRELGFHPAQTDRRQLLYTLPANTPSSANQIARSAFVSPTPPFSRRF